MIGNPGRLFVSHTAPACPPSGWARGIAAALVLVLFLGVSVSLAKEKDKLPARYREWLEKDVVYIISKEEKDAFLRLARDEDRDKFMERFWEIRNSSPGAPTNPYKDEHYKRLEYASHYFGGASATDGWRTDRGRVYITLGPPQQKARYTNLRNVRPMEVWFYSSTHPALPAFFYVVFYEREAGGDYRFYSPYLDGPDKLVTTDRVTNDRVGALRLVQDAAGREVARICLSLLPDEPVDMATATSSLQSDLLLSTIRNLANHPLNKLDLERRRELLESVTHRIIVGGEILGVVAVPLRDTQGNTNLHYLLRLRSPEDFALAESADGRFYYSVEVTTRIFGPDNKLIFTQDKMLSRYLDKAQLDQVKNKVFGYEGWVPLPPGKYKLEFLLTNLLKHTAFRAERQVVVPDVPHDGIHLAELVPFSEADAVDPVRSSILPFSVAGVKFTPLLGQDLYLVPGQDLKFFYQIWAPSRDPRAYQGKKLQVEYAYGRPGARGDSKVIREELPKEQFDPSGSLLNGKKIPLADLPAGNYLMTVTLSEPGSQQKAYGTLSFHISNSPPSPPGWDVYDEGIGEDVRKGLVDYQRGLCYLALGQKEQAAASFRRALDKNPAEEQARGRLVDLHFARQEYAQVAALYALAGLTNQTDEQTILRMAESLEKTGETRKAIALLESALAVKSANGPLYFALASYYQRTGELRKAAELERKGRALVAPTSTP